MTQTRRHIYIGIAALAALSLTLALYWPGLNGGFVFDDFPNLVHNPAFPVTSLSLDSIWTAAISSHSGPTRRPLSMLSFAVETYFFGLDPRVLKTTNLGIHLTNGLLVFFLLRHILKIRLKSYARSTESDFLQIEFLALSTTTIWLLAPINLTVVLFAIQRMESIAASFTLLGLIIYLKGRERMRNNHRFGAVLLWVGLLGATALGMLAKESAVMLPVYALVLEWVLFQGRDSTGRWDSRIWVLFTVVLIIPAIIGIAWLLPSILSGDAYANRPFDLSERLWTECRVLWSYINWILLPRLTTLSLYHDAYPLSQGWLNPATTITSALGLLVLIGSVLWLRSRRPLVTLGILWFLVGHLLVSTVVPLELVYEHRNYLPSLGMILAFTSLIIIRQSSQPVLATARIVFIFGVIVLFGFLTFLRASTWSDPLLLAWTEASNQPQSPRANYEFGNTLTMLSPDPSTPQFSKGMESFEYAAKLPGAGLLPDQALVLLSSKHGLPTNNYWWERMRRKISSQPLAAQDITALYNLVDCRIKSVCPLNDDELAQTLSLAVKKQQNSAEILTIYANFTVNITHDYLLALKLMQRSVALEPLKIQYWKNLATLQIALKEANSAKASISRIRELSSEGTDQVILESLEAVYSNTFTQ